MSWFGWLTKPAMEVTFMDRIIAAAEGLALIAVLLVVAVIVDRMMVWWRRRR